MSYWVRMPRIFIAIIFLGSLGCSPPEGTTTGEGQYFDVNDFAKTLIGDQLQRDKPVIKTVRMGEKVEVKSFSKTDSTFWANELGLYLISDLNKPSLKEEYIEQIGVQDQSSNLIMDVYKPKEGSTAELKSLVVYYLNNKESIRKVYIREESKSTLFYSVKESTLWTNHYAQNLLIDSIQTKVLNWRLGADTAKFNITTVVQ
jgi:hypothetical protein